MRDRLTTKLPPDPEDMNDARSEWANDAVESFVVATGVDPADALPDLLCDLMHWADRHGESQSFRDALDRASRHYAEETGRA